MGDITKNISRSELACNCGCGFDTMDYQTINIVQDCADHFAEKLGTDRVTVIITSAARCYEYNRVPVDQGGPGSNDSSQHPRGRAIDFFIKEVPLAEVYAYLMAKYEGKYGIGFYPASNFIHVDTRGYMARW